MQTYSKLQIYKGIIKYILENTNYTLQDISHLTNCSIKNIRKIYFGKYIPVNFPSELALLRLYLFILEIKAKKNISKKYKI